MGQPNYKNGFKLTLHPHMLFRPLSWKRPQMVFVNSMSDLFQEGVPIEYIREVFAIMRQASWHQFQILTKRAERLEELGPTLDWPKNVWMGVSVENEKYSFRIEHLRRTQAHIKFLSLEPLLGPLESLDLEGIDWVIVGGESGPRARSIREKWVLDIRDQCQKASVPFFFKQWGGSNKKRTGRLLDGQSWNEMPLKFRSPQPRTFVPVTVPNKEIPSLQRFSFE
jgi:protein gp37